MIVNGFSMSVLECFPFERGTLGANFGCRKVNFRFLGPLFWANMLDNLGGFRVAMKELAIKTMIYLQKTKYICMKGNESVKWLLLPAHIP